MYYSQWWGNKKSASQRIKTIFNWPALPYQPYKEMTLHLCIADQQFLLIRTDPYVLLWCKVVNQRWLTLDELIRTGVLITRLITAYMTVMVFVQSHLLREKTFYKAETFAQDVVCQPNTYLRTVKWEFSSLQTPQEGQLMHQARVLLTQP